MICTAPMTNLALVTDKNFYFYLLYLIQAVLKDPCIALSIQTVYLVNNFKYIYIYIYL